LKSGHLLRKGITMVLQETEIDEIAGQDSEEHIRRTITD